VSASVRAASALARAWVWLYTARLPEQLRNARRAEIEADLWEHQHDRLLSRTAPGVAATEILLRTWLGAFDDLGWRFEVLQAARSGSNNRRILMPRFSRSQIRWMGLAGLVGGSLWAINVLSLVLRHRADGPPAYPVLPVLVAALLVAGLVGFLTIYRERLGTKGTIGVWLLVVSQASFLLSNTMYALPHAENSTAVAFLGVVFGVGFAMAPIPGFILIGLTLTGRARAGAYLVAVVGPLGMVLPSVLARFGVMDPGLLRTDSPVSLAYGIYFILAAAWLAVAGYVTFRQAHGPVGEGPTAAA